MKTWALPEDPDEEVNVLRDDAGNTYTRMSDNPNSYWWGNEPKVRGSYSWADLLWQRGPVTEVEQ